MLDAISDRFKLTLQLGGRAFLITMVVGVPLGVLAAVRSRTSIDRGVVSLSVVGVSAPAFATGILLLYVFAVELGWFPVFGLGEEGLDRIYHLTLPAIALAIALCALVARVTRASLASALEQEFVETARSRGFSERRVIGKHALRSALIPVVTITGLVFGFLIAGAVLVEYTFGLNGLGALLIQAVRTRDFPVVQGVTLVFIVAFIVINLLVDLLYALVDPRVRLQGKAT